MVMFEAGDFFLTRRRLGFPEMAGVRSVIFFFFPFFFFLFSFFFFSGDRVEKNNVGILVFYSDGFPFFFLLFFFLACPQLGE